MSFVSTATAGGSMLGRAARPGMGAPVAPQQEMYPMGGMAKPQALGAAPPPMGAPPMGTPPVGPPVMGPPPAMGNDHGPGMGTVPGPGGPSMPPAPGYGGGGGPAPGSPPMGGGQGASYQYTVGDAGAIQRDIQGADYYNEAAQKAYMDQARRGLDPQWQQTAQENESKLVNMGLSRGSEAWEREMANLARNKADAYGSATNQSILNAGAEGTRMQGMDLSQGNFRNAAQGQQYDQNFRNASMWNNAAAAQDSTMLGNRAQDTAAFSAYNNADVNRMNAGTSRFSAENNADVANRRTVLDENRGAFELSRDMRRAPIEEQNLMMQGMYPTGSPTYSQNGTGTPNADTNAGGGGGPGQAQAVQGQYAGYNTMGGGLLNTGLEYYNRRPTQAGGYNGAGGPGRFGDT